MLSISGLKAGYDGKTIVDIPGLSLAPGEHCLITGQSGSGKTTLLYALAGLLSPTSGTIRLLDRDLTNMPGSERDAFRGRHIGIIYQNLHTVQALSLLDNLLLAQYAASTTQDSKKAEALLAQLGLFDYRHRKPGQLSHGQQQRLAIARAAMNNPALILGDEPTSALDDDTCATVLQLLLDTAKAANASLIVATHDARIKPFFTRHIALESLS